MSKITIKAASQEFLFDEEKLSEYSVYFDGILKLSKQTVFDFSFTPNETVKALSDLIDGVYKPYQCQLLDTALIFAQTISCDQLEGKLQEEIMCKEYFVQFEKEKKCEFNNGDIVDALLNLCGDHFPKFSKYLLERRREQAITEFLFDDGYINFWTNYQNRDFDEHMERAANEFFYTHPKECAEKIIEIAIAVCNSNYDPELIRKDPEKFCVAFYQGGGNNVTKFLKKDEKKCKTTTKKNKKAKKSDSSDSD